MYLCEFIHHLQERKNLFLFSIYHMKGLVHQLTLHPWDVPDPLLDENIK